MRKLNRLSDRGIRANKAPGLHADGGGLYLFVDQTGAKRWVFIFQWRKRRREMGLGGFNSVSLTEAREKAEEARRLVARGVDPIQARKAVGVAPRTFHDIAIEVLADLEPQWKNAKHRDQWRMHLTVLAKPLAQIPVAEIGTDDVLRTLKPIWNKTPETASRVRARIERVLDVAKVKGMREGENPARWKGHLELLLPRRGEKTRGHHKALPFDELPAFLAKLRAVEGVSALALEFAILTAARSGEVFGARWEEFDIKRRVWTVPAWRMKAGKEHRVPLTREMLRVLIQAKKLRQPYVFPGTRRGKPLSSMALDMVVRRMKVDCTVHGFRSTFRDWAGETTTFQREVAEAALAHAVGDRVEQAYRRGDALAKRRELMNAWDRFCARPRAVGTPADRP